MGWATEGPSGNTRTRSRVRFAAVSSSDEEEEPPASAAFASPLASEDEPDLPALPFFLRFFALPWAEGSEAVPLEHWWSIGRGGWRRSAGLEGREGRKAERTERGPRPHLAVLGLEAWRGGGEEEPGTGGGAPSGRVAATRRQIRPGGAARARGRSGRGRSPVRTCEDRLEVVRVGTPVDFGRVVSPQVGADTCGRPRASGGERRAVRALPARGRRHTACRSRAALRLAAVPGELDSPRAACGRAAPLTGLASAKRVRRPARARAAGKRPRRAPPPASASGPTHGLRRAPVRSMRFLTETCFVIPFSLAPSPCRRRRLLREPRGKMTTKAAVPFPALPLAAATPTERLAAPCPHSNPSRPSSCSQRHLSPLPGTASPGRERAAFPQPSLRTQPRRLSKRAERRFRLGLGVLRAGEERTTLDVVSETPHSATSGPLHRIGFLCVVSGPA